RKDRFPVSDQCGFLWRAVCLADHPGHPYRVPDQDRPERPADRAVCAVRNLELGRRHRRAAGGAGFDLVGSGLSSVSIGRPALAAVCDGVLFYLAKVRLAKTLAGSPTAWMNCSTGAANFPSWSEAPI